MSKIVNKRKAIFLDSADRQYKELGYPHRNIIVYECSKCRKLYQIDESILAKYCYLCGAYQLEDQNDE